MSDPTRPEGPSNESSSGSPPPSLGNRNRGVFERDVRQGDRSFGEPDEERRAYASALRKELRAIAYRRNVAAQAAQEREPLPSQDRENRTSAQTEKANQERNEQTPFSLSRAARRVWYGLRSFIGPRVGGAAVEKDRCGDLEDVTIEAEDAARTSLAGLALSGGGIRSATFALGALQALNESKLLGEFDYCSTVSGGGFVGGWWSAWLSRAHRRPSGDIFPRDERLEPDRFPAALLDETGSRIGRPSHLPAGDDAIPEGSQSVADHDPLHHLRLFSNYLTPRRGLLSADSWRAITIVSRNMVLTWLVMLPLMLAAALLGQLYFAGRRDVGYQFVCSVPDKPAAVAAASAGAAPSSTPEVADDAICRNAAAAGLTITAHRQVLIDRLNVLVPPLLMTAILLVLFVVLWMLYSSGSVPLTFVGFVGLGGLLYVLFVFQSEAATGASWFSARWKDFADSRWLMATLVVSGVSVAVLGLGPLVQQAWAAGGATMGASAGEPMNYVPRDLARNRIIRWHARALIAATVFITALLLFGFGHELIWYLFYPQTGAVEAAARRTGGYLALLIAISSAVTTFVKAFPSPKGHDAVGAQPGRLASIAIALAPVLTVVALAIGCAGLGHWILRTRTEWIDPASPENNAAARALLAGVVLIAIFGVAESWHFAEIRNTVIGAGKRLALAVGLLGSLAVVLLFVSRGRIPSGATIAVPATAYTLLSVGVAIVALRIADSVRSTLRRVVLVSIAAGAAVTIQWWLSGFLVANPGDGASAMIYLAAVAASLFVTGYLLFDWIGRLRVSSRVTVLMSIALGGCFALVLLHHLPHTLRATAMATTGLGWAGFLIAWVVGLGWMVDPNLIALHNFYKARLVRAYLGASNAENRKRQDISETAPGDDVLMKDLKNHCHGAPLHLVNATLNLVGGRDLATAQRSAALFTMSSQICGSARTGYRMTSEYMSGKLTLGTAIAASGAAVSPTMGAKSVSAALSLLLALFNVRLGYWAPTPNKRRWRESQPRMWPYYLLTEALSQTNDLGSYCYLTDGGHFDNTGIYALVERGCQTIVALDDGADPRPCFSDVGEVVRRCRIDFGAEIRLEDGVDAFVRAEHTGVAPVHYVLGTIEYKPAHLRMLGWSDEDIARARPAQIIWIKPSVTARDSIDVRQYRLENDAFPQQTTADQWFDEAQFESYRALGFQSVIFRLNELVAQNIYRITAAAFASAPTTGVAAPPPGQDYVFVPARWYGARRQP